MAAKRAVPGGAEIAAHEPCSGRRRSFAELSAAANGLAAGLIAAGLAQGGRLGVFCGNRPEDFILLIACQKTGGLGPLNWRRPAAGLAATRAPFGIPAFEGTGTALAQQPGTAVPDLDAEPKARVAAGHAGRAGAIPACPGVCSSSRAPPGGPVR